MTPGRVVVVAHRAGNGLATLRAAEAHGVDMVELDVHLFRGRLEVRHAKTMGPLAILWERWHLVRPFGPRLGLAEVLVTARPDTHLLVDLKGPSPRLGRMTRDLMRATCPERRYTVCARNWLALRPFRDEPNANVVRSAGGPHALRALLRGDTRSDGVAVDQRLLTRQVVVRLHARSARIFTWGVTSRERLRELQAVGVDGFILDDVTLADASADG